MVYNLILTDRADELIDERVNYLIKISDVFSIENIGYHNENKAGGWDL